jgi:selenocysteine lyase/cysteine desulfurase
MLVCQKDRFSLPDNITYLNCAYMSPLMNSVEVAGYQGVARKTAPFEVFPNHFFDPVQAVRKAYSRLINAQDPERIALIPSVSYGIANVVNNIKAEKGQNIIMVDEQFPSNYYSWERLAKEKGLTIRMIKPDEHTKTRGENWNNRILEAINQETVVVTMPNIHWADGTKFDLISIRERTKEVGAKLIIDGTQSVGALEFDVQKIQPDALINVAYKWLLGPYSSGLAYYGEAFDNGIPIEESWMNRVKSEDFRGLVNYQKNYRPKAARYNVGEASNFMAIPMMEAALKAILDWGVQNIQEYCGALTDKFLPEFMDMGCQVEDPKYRAKHLFGIRLSENFDLNELKAQFMKNKVFVSFRGNAIRIAPHLYNDEGDFETLVDCFKKARKKTLV